MVFYNNITIKIEKGQVICLLYTSMAEKKRNGGSGKKPRKSSYGAWVSVRYTGDYEEEYNEEYSEESYDEAAEDQNEESEEIEFIETENE